MLAGRNSTVRVHTRDNRHLRTCVCVCVDDRVSVSTHTCVYMHLCLFCARLHDYVYVWLHACVIVVTRKCTCWCVHTCVCEMMCLII